jgi:hypothetical protein
MSIKLTNIGSRNVTVEVRPAPFPDAAGGVCLCYGLHDGPLTFTLTVPEARALVSEITEQLTTPPPW